MVLRQFRQKLLSLATTLLAISLLFSSARADSATNLTINYIEGKPAESQYAYAVTATFSLLDSAGNPIKDLKLEDISLNEDGQGVTPTSLDIVSGQPIYLSLLLDTSGSMTGSRNDAAVAAATQFVSGLNPDDRISVTTFNSEINKIIDFSTDHETTKTLISSIEAVSKSGTCLFDAAYKAVQDTAALPLGRRAVVILTDGKDESPTGGPCSKLTIDDVIRIASEGNTRVPIFTIGLGDTIDEAGLVRISTLSGGRYEKSPSSDQLDSSFSRLLDLLQSQYLLQYISTAAPGNHTLSIKASYLNSSFSDSRDFVLPELPLSLTIVSPTNGQEIVKNVKIAIALNGRSNPIEHIVFSVNGVVIGTDDTTPYELEWASDSSHNGEVVFLAQAIGADGAELAADTVTAVINSGSSTIQLLGPDSSSKFTRWFSKEKLPVTIGISVAVISLIVIGVILLSSKKKKESKSRDDQWNKLVGGKGDNSNKMDDMTFDGFVLSENSLGALMVMQSDDPAMVGQRFELAENSTRLGRAADNDILFPKDGPVSRHHAIIENRDGQLILSELVSPSGDGIEKTPTFGTYVNDQKVSQPIALRNGDLIRLGKRVALKFECANQIDDDDDARTMDEFGFDDTDKTVDSL